MGAEESPGLFVTARRLLQLTAQAMHVRIGIFSIELREEGARLLRLFVLAAVALFLGGMALLLLSLAAVYSVWDDPQARVAVVWGLVALYAAGAGLTGLVLARTLKRSQQPFADTMREFEKDKEWIQADRPPAPEQE